MKNQENKKNWEKPSIQILNIKKDTFTGSGKSNETHANSNSNLGKPDNGVSSNRVR